jgi:hypothetical protein
MWLYSDRVLRPMMAAAGIASGAGSNGALLTWVLVTALLFFGSVGMSFLLAGRRWANRLKHGQAPPPLTVWSGTYTVPRHPEDGNFLGIIFLGLAGLAFVGLVGHLINVW